MPPVIRQEVDICVDKETGEVSLYEVVPIDWEDRERWVPLDSYQQPLEQVDLSDQAVFEEWLPRTYMWKLRTESETVLDMLMAGSLTPVEAKVFTFVGRQVRYLNLVYVRVSDVVEALDLSKNMANVALTNLEKKGLLKVEYKNTNGYGTRVIAMHPFYFWLGDYKLRDNYVRKWVKEQTERNLPKDYLYRRDL